VQATVLTILLVDDHQLVRHGLCALLQRAGFDVVAQASDGLEAVRLMEAHRPDVAVLDAWMPGQTGIETARQLLAQDPAAAVVLLTDGGEDHHALAALRLGIRGCVAKTEGSAQLTQAIREVAAGGRYLGPGASKTLVDAYLTGAEERLGSLTERQRCVLELVATGKTTREVAGELGVTPKVAETYRANLMSTLGVCDTAGLVRYAVRHGVIDA
jgi:DNA-binding NarL/FixJ family response regulator